MLRSTVSTGLFPGVPQVSGSARHPGFMPQGPGPGEKFQGWVARTCVWGLEGEGAADRGLRRVRDSRRNS